MVHVERGEIIDSVDQTRINHLLIIGKDCNFGVGLEVAQVEWGAIFTDYREWSTPGLIDAVNVYFALHAPSGWAICIGGGQASIDPETLGDYRQSGQTLVELANRRA